MSDIFLLTTKYGACEGVKMIYPPQELEPPISIPDIEYSAYEDVKRCLLPQNCPIILVTGLLEFENGSPSCGCLCTNKKGAFDLPVYS